MRLFQWKIKRTAAKPVNFLKKSYLKSLKKNIKSPIQISQGENGNSYFGLAVSKFYSGEASIPNSETISAKDLFFFLRKYLNEIINKNSNDSQSLKRNESNEAINGVSNEEFATNSHPHPQNPIIVAPIKQSHLISNPVGFRISPPCPPEAPFVIHLGDNEVTLEWYNPPFDGIPPFKYKIAMRNESRNFNKWNDIYYPGEIRGTRFTVRNLPIGVPCEFRVAGFNNGGWGRYSEESVTVTPGEQRKVLNEAQKWKEIMQKGIEYAIDVLEASKHSFSDFSKGLKFIHSNLQASLGINERNIALKIASISIFALKSFGFESNIVFYSLRILGWCMNNVSTERRVRQYCIQNGIIDILFQKLNHYRSNTKVVNAIVFLRSKMPNYFPSIPDTEYKTLFPQSVSKNVAASSDEEDDEGDVEDDELNNSLTS